LHTQALPRPVTSLLDATAAKNIAVIGSGTLGNVLIDALLAAAIPGERIRVTVKHRERAIALSERLDLAVTTDNRAAVHGAQIVLICVKPQYMREVLAEISTELTDETLIVSIATGVTTAVIESVIARRAPVVRAMPNTACRIGKGMTVLCRGRHATDASMAVAESLFSLMGRTAVGDENLMDAVTALSASGPAFIYTILEALAEGGVRVGLPRNLATLLAAQATLGAASMVLETGQHPALLKSEVTTPGGCTVDGILELEDGKIRASLIRAVAATTKKAARLALPLTVEQRATEVGDPNR
jgi:pyrroline-5-carboxylate reductase